MGMECRPALRDATGPRARRFTGPVGPCVIVFSAQPSGTDLPAAPEIQHRGGGRF